MSASEILASSLRRPQIAVSRAAKKTAALHNILLALSFASAGVLVVGQLEDGWWHHDDGSFGQSAERVLQGELPHRDFADLYTGLLTFMNAGVFALLGHDIFNLRVPLVMLFFGFVGCFFALARRFVGPVGAFLATLFAITWTVPVYPAPMPSWYLLFLATIGTFAVVRFRETDHRRWLLVAGACGGVAIAIKVIGLWFVTAVVLALLIRPLLDHDRRTVRDTGWVRHFVLVISSALLSLTLVTAVFSGHPVPSEVVSLFVPVAVLCGAVAVIGWRARQDSREGIDVSVIEVGTFLVGVTVPLAIFIVPYAISGSLAELIEGVLIAPRSRYEFSSYDGPHPATLLRAAPVVLLLLVRRRLSDRWKRPLDVGVAAAIALLVVTASNQLSYSLLWGTTRALAPCIVVLGAALILRRRWVAEVRQSEVALVVLVAGFMALVQFPFAAPIYFNYSAPLVLLAAIAAARVLGIEKGLLPTVALIALVIFGARQLDNQTLLSLGHAFRTEPRVLLDDTRASVGVHPSVKAEYDRVREVAAQHVRAGDVIFAGPDAPEIYYLTETRNLTPALIDFLDASGSTRGTELIHFLGREQVPFVVLNHAPQQSPRLEPETVEDVRSMYAGSTRVGHFELLWGMSGAR